MKILCTGCFVSVFLFLQSACTNKSTLSVDNDLDSYSIDVSIGDVESLNMRDIAESYSVICLESSEQALVGQINQVFLDDSNIIVWDSKQGNVLSFGIDGKYKNQIGKKGGSPSDYVHISDVKYDKQKKIISILDTSTKRILQYDIYGNYLNSIKLPCVFFSFLSTKNGYWGFSGFTNKYGVTFIDKNLNVKQNYFYADKPIRLMPTNYFTENEKGEYFFHARYEDVIYKIDGDTLKSFITLNFGQNKNPYNDINSAEFRSFVEKSNYLGRIRDVYMYENKLFFSFSDFHGLNEQETIYHAFIDLNQPQITPLIYRDVRHFEDIPVSPLPEIINISEGKLIYQIIPGILPEKAISSLTKYSNDISSESNPILVIYNLGKN
ncbi:6-bladed beta-propeller [Viscerimonas tarda]